MCVIYLKEDIKLGVRMWGGSVWGLGEYHKNSQLITFLFKEQFNVVLVIKVTRPTGVCEAKAEGLDSC